MNKRLEILFLISKCMYLPVFIKSLPMHCSILMNFEILKLFKFIYLGC